MRVVTAGYALVRRGPGAGSSSLLVIGVKSDLPHGLIIMMPEIQRVRGCQCRGLREWIARIW